jgi:hypothetical protein
VDGDEGGTKTAPGQASQDIEHPAAFNWLLFRQQICSVQHILLDVGFLEGMEDSPIKNPAKSNAQDTGTLEQWQEAVVEFDAQSSVVPPALLKIKPEHRLTAALALSRGPMPASLVLVQSYLNKITTATVVDGINAPAGYQTRSPVGKLFPRVGQTQQFKLAVIQKLVTWAPIALDWHKWGDPHDAAESDGEES